MTRLVPIIFLCVAAASPAFAQQESGSAAAARAATDKAAKDKTIGDAMGDTLRKAGFTELRIMPNSVLVRAKDKVGNPVAMVFDPATMTEIVTLDPHGGSALAGDGRTSLPASGPFVTVMPTAKLASTLIGLNVRGTGDTDVATIKDLAIDHDRVQAYIVTVGGLLGIGDRTIVVAPAAITLVYDQVANAYSAKMQATSDQLKKAPDFTYEGAFKAKRD